MIRRLSAISAIGTIVFMSCAGIAGAYSITGSGAPNSTPSAGVSLQPLPSGTFSPDWGSFLKNLPVPPV
jgi:hypothetical protein